MLTQTSYAERHYQTSAALDARSARQAAEACNDLASETEASILALILDGLPDEAPAMLCEFFETRGIWPADSVDTAFLNNRGQIVWRAAKAAGGRVA